MTTRPQTAETSVGRALRVVDAIARTGDGVTAKALARKLGYTLPTTYRLLAELVEEGYLVRLPELRGYGLGYRIGGLARRLIEQLAAPWPVPEILREVHRSGGGAAYYAVLRGDHVVVAHADDCPAHPTPRPLRVGEPAAAHAAAAGKVMLAGLDRRRLANVLPEPLPSKTPRTVTDRARLTEELRRVREAGLAVEVDELLIGLAEVAAPVHAPDGGVRGAIGLTVHRTDFAARRAALERMVGDCARRATEALAHRAQAG